jgi:hypothetical protein
VAVATLNNVLELKKVLLVIGLLSGLLAGVLAGVAQLAPKAAPPPPPTTTKPPVATIGPAATIHPPAPNHRFPVGETYVFEGEWRLFNAGSATLKMESAGPEMRVLGSADSQGFVNLLYRVHDRFESAFDPRTFCSVRVIKHSEEGFHKRDTQISFDYSQRKSILNERNLKDNQTKRQANDIPGCVTDVFASFFYLASLPLTPGSSYEFPLNDGGKTVVARASVEAREPVKTNGGNFQTIRVAAEAISGPLKDKGHIWIWYSDDAARIPVQMRARLFWGTLTFRLQRVEKR